jgi:argininosuccinate lyase
MAHALPEVNFIRENIRMEQQLYATEDAYRLVTEEGPVVPGGLPAGRREAA